MNGSYIYVPTKSSHRFDIEVPNLAHTYVRTYVCTLTVNFSQCPMKKIAAEKDVSCAHHPHLAQWRSYHLYAPVNAMMLHRV